MHRPLHANGPKPPLARSLLPSLVSSPTFPSLISSFAFSCLLLPFFLVFSCLSFSSLLLSSLHSDSFLPSLVSFLIFHSCALYCIMRLFMLIPSFNSFLNRFPLFCSFPLFMLTPPSSVSLFLLILPSLLLSSHPDAAYSTTLYSLLI